MTIDIDPVIVHAGPLLVSWYGVVNAIALVVGSWLALREARRKGLPSDRVESIAFWIIPSGNAARSPA
ncbi:MAG: prolipoprotein diacylglyceryl transferase [Candidatus Limnocylindria bacterium]|nr:prolipoprotein diacylglyceryl transferase [Candidatus Limnocylindria bacterium]